MFVKVSALRLKEQAQLFNLAFEKYVLPMHLSVEQYAQKLALEGVDSDHSVVLREDGAPRGIALLAVEGDEGWVAGMGVAPELRGKGQGRALMEQVIEQAKALKLRRLRLEVLTQNDPALATYERLGFKILRELALLKANACPLTLKPVSVAEIVPDKWVDVYSIFHPFEPCWQRSPFVLRRIIKELIPTVLGLRDEDNRNRAGVLFIARDRELRILDLGARTTEEGKLTEILGYLARKFPNCSMTLNNEPAESPFLPVLKECGFEETGRQYEMALDLAN